METLIARTEEEISAYTERILQGITGGKLIPYVGFDTEGDPQTQEVRLIQVCTQTKEGQCVCYLFHIYATSGKLFCLSKLLTNPNVIKVGVGIQGDLEKVHKQFSIYMRGVLDIQYLAITLDIPDISMDSLCTKLCSSIKKLPSNRKAKWAVLSPSDIAYASNDAYVSLRLYQSIMNMEIPVNNTLEFGSKDTDTISDYVNMYLWLKERFQAKRVDKAINFVINSYAPWRKTHTLDERKKLCTEAFSKLKEMGYIHVMSNELMYKK